MDVRRRVTLLTIAALLLLLPLPASATRVRVAILKAASTTVKGMDLVVKDQAGRPVPLPDAYAEVPVSVEKGKLAIGGRAVEGELITLESRSVYFRVGSRQYRELVTIYKDGDRLLAVNAIDLEDYLVGLINHEISSQWPEEAVRAQAVVARTYALFQANNSRDPRFDLESTVDDQVYGGSQTEDYASAKAVRDTAGEVLVDGDGNVVEAFYCSSCGGITELPQNVWGTRTAITKSVKDPWCASAPGSTWSMEIGAKELGAKLAAAGYDGGEVDTIAIEKKTAADRALSVKLVAADGTSHMSGNELRRVIGYDRLKSARFTVKKKGDVFVFDGRGAGHGVGMCQWGAKGMADAGYSYRQILGNYYPGLYLRAMDKLPQQEASNR